LQAEAFTGNDHPAVSIYFELSINMMLTNIIEHYLNRKAMKAEFIVNEVEGSFKLEPCLWRNIYSQEFYTINFFLLHVISDEQSSSLYSSALRVLPSPRRVFDSNSKLTGFSLFSVLEMGPVCNLPIIERLSRPGLFRGKKKEDAVWPG